MQLRIQLWLPDRRRQLSCWFHLERNHLHFEYRWELFGRLGLERGKLRLEHGRKLYGWISLERDKLRSEYQR